METRRQDNLQRLQGAEIMTKTNKDNGTALQEENARWKVNGHFVVRDDNGKCVAKVYGGATYPCNAYLIAAAPEMYEALRVLEQACEIAFDKFDDIEVDGEMVDARDLMKVATKVLKKARGET